MVGRNTPSRSRFSESGEAHASPGKSHGKPRGPQARDQGTCVRSVWHHRRYAEGTDGGRNTLPRTESLGRLAEQLRHLVAPHPLRELHDRRPLRSRAHAVPADWASRGLPRHGPLRHRLHAGRGALARSRDREAETVSRRRRGTREAAGQGIQARDPLERGPRYAASRGAAYRISVRSRHFGAGGGVFQAALEDLCQGNRDHRPRSLEHPLRRQSPLRLHRREILRHADGVHRPPGAAVRADAASARPYRGRFRRAGRGVGLRGERCDRSMAFARLTWAYTVIIFYLPLALNFCTTEILAASVSRFGANVSRYARSCWTSRVI